MTCPSDTGYWVVVNMTNKPGLLQIQSSAILDNIKARHKSNCTSIWSSDSNTRLRETSMENRHVVKNKSITRIQLVICINTCRAMMKWSAVGTWWVVISEMSNNWKQVHPVVTNWELCKEEDSWLTWKPCRVSILVSLPVVC